MTARAGAKLVAEYQAKRITELESEVAEERAQSNGSRRKTTNGTPARS